MVGKSFYVKGKVIKQEIIKEERIRKVGFFHKKEKYKETCYYVYIKPNIEVSEGDCENLIIRIPVTEELYQAIYIKRQHSPDYTISIQLYVEYEFTCWHVPATQGKELIIKASDIETR